MQKDLKISLLHLTESQKAAWFDQTVSIKQEKWCHPLACSTWTSSVINPDTPGGGKDKQEAEVKVQEGEVKRGRREEETAQMDKK